MRYLMAGDLHGAHGHVRYLAQRAKAENVDKIIQLGDFGFWEHTQQGVLYLDKSNQYLAEEGITLYFVDGNHENHPMLRVNYGPEGKMYNPTPEGFWQIRENIFYIPRGTAWEWNGVKFLGLGGAYSVDKQWRKVGSSWWPEETITYGEANKACEAGKVDVLLSHDAPISIPLEKLMGDRWWKSHPETDQNRSLLEAVVTNTKPSRIFHGHYHFRYDYALRMINNCIVTGIGCENVNDISHRAKDSWVIFNDEAITAKD